CLPEGPMLVQGGESLTSVAVGPARLWYTALGSAAGVYSCPLADCSGGPVLEASTSAPIALSYYGGEMYWRFGGQLLSCPESGCVGPPKVYVENRGNGYSVGVSGVWVSGSSEGIDHCPAAGCGAGDVNAEHLAPGTGYAQALALGTTHVYWVIEGIGSGAVGEVYEMPIIGGAAKLRASQQPRPRGIVVSA